MSSASDQPERPHLALEAEVAFFEAHRARWIAEGHEGQWAAIQGDRLLGFFGSMTDAYALGVRAFGSEPFLIKEVRARDPIAIVKRTDERKRA
jgi:hypothetical protein